MSDLEQQNREDRLLYLAGFEAGQKSAQAAHEREVDEAFERGYDRGIKTEQALPCPQCVRHEEWIRILTIEREGLRAALEAMLDAYEGVFDSVAEGKRYQSDEAREAEEMARAALAQRKEGE